MNTAMETTRQADLPSGHSPRDFACQKIGWIETANSVAARVRASVPAYRRFLEALGVAEDAPFAQLPITDKTSYLVPSPYADLLADDHGETFTITRSSGASGRSFRWPQLKADYRWSARRMRMFLESTFRIHERRTIAVVALSLGSWAGGDHYSWCLKNVALETPYPFAVFSPGNQHDEIIEFLRQRQPAVDQFLVMICPSVLGYLLLLAESTGRPLPLEQMRFLVTGEAFPEDLRESLRRRSGLGASEPFMFSLYGSADAGALGVESPATVALRQWLAADPGLAADLGFGPVVPLFFHCTATDAYYETVGGELCVTRWQGIPLVRYNLHDSARLLAWEPLRQALLASASPRDRRDEEWRRVLEDAQAMPDLIALSGRADSCLVLGGTKLTQAMLDEAVVCPELRDILTGTYQVSLVVEEGRTIAAMDVELRPGINPGPAILDQIYYPLVQALGRVQPEFASDWRNLYCKWDDDPLRRVLRVRALSWPALSEDSAEQIKRGALT